MNTASRAARLISLILPLGRGHALLEALDREKGLVTAFSHHALTALRSLGLALFAQNLNCFCFISICLLKRFFAGLH